MACHNARLSQGGLALETRAQVLKVVTPGNGAASLLIERVSGAKGPRMPLNSPPLSSEEISTLKVWIDEGAKGPATAEAQSWKPALALKAPAMPESREAHPVDKFLKTPEGAVSDAVFARRAYLDLWGLLPTPAQLDAFVADRDAGKYGKLVDRLLANRANYANHWISFWNDHLHNDEGVVYHGDRKTISKWLRQSLEDNLAYDKFVQGLLNPAKDTGPEGFLIGVNWRGDINASQTPVMQAAQNTAQVFLGINLKCNSCHDSFINQWKLKDAYGLASFFSDAPLEIHRCDSPTGVTAQTKFLYPELGGVDTAAPLAEKRAAAAKLFTSAENGRTPRTLVNRYWKVLFGRGIVEPVDDMDAKPSNPELLDWLAADFVAHGYDLQHLLRTIMTSRAYRLPSGREAGPLPRRLTAEQFLDNVSAVTGEWRTLDPKAPGAATYARDWQLKSTPLGRALGRAIRDQIMTERQNQPTTLQALELVNGDTLATLLHRGALRLRDQLPPAPASLYDSGILNTQKDKAEVDVEIAGAEKLWLVLADIDSYDPARTLVTWQNARFDDRAPRDLPAPVPSTQTVDVPTGAQRFRATIVLDPSSKASDINPRFRLFVFRQQPDMRRLYPVDGQPPIAPPEPTTNSDRLIARLYRHALGRLPSQKERAIALDMARTNDGLEDLLWSVFLSPEFQYVR
ncbi:MAG: PSD1 domain-containing protein [Proteobacteria bacterium]|nr:PSD1 domain-containing protein [Pseudomonadota bacterium]